MIIGRKSIFSIYPKNEINQSSKNSIKLKHFRRKSCVCEKCGIESKKIIKLSNLLTDFDLNLIKNKIHAKKEYEISVRKNDRSKFINY